MQNGPKFLVAATCEKANTWVFAGMVIHNPKVGGSIPPPATNISIYFNYLPTDPKEALALGGGKMGQENEVIAALLADLSTPSNRNWH